MTRKTPIFFILGFALIALVADLHTAVRMASAATAALTPQTTVSGDWKATLAKDDSKLNLMFERRTATGRHGQMDNTFEFSELGLTREQVINGGPVRFTLAREAGTIACEGSFENQKGAGTFTFTPNAAFLSAMKSRGFDFEKDNERNGGEDINERLFAAATLNVTTALADDLASAGFGKLTVGDLFKAAIFHINSAYMREMKDTGFPNLKMEDLVKARIFNIDAAFVRKAAEMGFTNQSFEGLVKMSIFKVTPEFLAEVRNEGLTNLSVEEVVKLRIFKIDADFIRKAKADGVPLNVESLVREKLGTRRMARRSVAI
jgi:hypothetical protein